MYYFKKRLKENAIAGVIILAIAAVVYLINLFINYLNSIV